MQDTTTVKEPVKLTLAEADWRRRLAPARFHIAREHGAERALSGPNWEQKAAGRYDCVCCDAPLFSSATKFDSGTGWPSFFAPLAPASVVEHKDRSWFMRHTKVRCARCDAHLGHVFPDGPKRTGLRDCMNGTALAFVPAQA